MQDFAGPSKVGIITERGKSSNSWWLCQIKNARVDRINEQLKGCLLMQLEEHANQPKQLKIWVFGQMLAIYMLFMIGYAIYFRSVGWCVEWMVFTTLKKNQTCIYIYIVRLAWFKVGYISTFWILLGQTFQWCLGWLCLPWLPMSLASVDLWKRFGWFWGPNAVSRLLGW